MIRLSTNQTPVPSSATNSLRESIGKRALAWNYILRIARRRLPLPLYALLVVVVYLPNNTALVTDSA